MWFMNRIEVVGIFTALNVLVKKNDIDGIKEIVEAVLDETVTSKKDIASRVEKKED